MKKYNFIFIIILFFSFNFFILPNFSFADNTNGININLDVSGCNRNGICEKGVENFLICPEDCKKEGGSSGGSIPVDQNNLFSNFLVQPSYTTATITWTSIIPTIYVLKWGESTDYQNGTLKNVNFVNDHSVEISNLKSNTTYFFTIEAQTYLGKTVVLDNKTFTTLVPPDKEAPMNPTGTVASSVLSGVTLSWTNPRDEDFSYIRVVRSSDFYQSDPYSGKLVYEGSGQYLRDGDVKKGEHYYYTLFARDKSGNFSSGSMIDIIYLPPETGEIPVVPVVVEPEKEIQFVTPTTPISYYVEQNGIIKNFDMDGIISLDGENISIVIADFNAEKPAYDFWMEIKDKDNKVAGRYFFGNIEGDNERKQVVVPPIRGNGEYDVFIYRHFEKQIELIHEGVFDVTTAPEAREVAPFLYQITIAGIILVIILFPIFLWWFLRQIFLHFFGKKNK